MGTENVTDVGCEKLLSENVDAESENVDEEDGFLEAEAVQVTSRLA